jgi:hypothetical protein
VSLESASTANPLSLFSLVRQVCSATWQALAGRSRGGSGLRPTTPCGSSPLTRLRDDPRSRAYAERRTKQGKTTNDILRCLKRFLARELLPLLKADLQQANSTR